jgi:hypothetical protein
MGSSNLKGCSSPSGGLLKNERDATPNETLLFGASFAVSFQGGGIGHQGDELIAGVVLFFDQTAALPSG